MRRFLLIILGIALILPQLSAGCASAASSTSTIRLRVGQYCGNGVIEGVEQCDDDNNISGDGCSASCLTEYCGDGSVNNNGTEECDDGNAVSDDGCSAACVIEYCGDGIDNNGTEECDDGNAVSGDGCSALCVIEYCGDAVINNGEVCDGNTQACSSGGYNGVQLCNGSCSGWQACVPSEFCGDGSINGPEACDDGNAADCDGCRSDCTRIDMACGDGYLECGEICDSTLGVPSGYRCTSACLLERLGYGAVLPDFFLGVEIYNIQKQVDRFSATITWDTNKDAVCSFEWGRTLQYFTNIANEIEYKRTHAVRVIDLMPATTYFYTMECRDGWEHQANTPVYRFTTEQLEDKTAPANVSNFKAGAATDAIILSWENPPDADLAGVKIVRSERFFARSQSEGKVIFSGRGTRALDREVAPGKRYYYTAFAYDKNGNYSSGSLASALVKKPGTSGIVKQAEPAATQPRDKREEQAGEGERPIEKPAEPGVEVEPFPEPQEPQEPQEPEDDGQSRLPEEIEALEFPYDKLEFYAALGSLRVEAENKEVYYYSGTEFSVKIAKDLLPEGVAGLILSLKKADDSRAEYQNYYFEGNGSENEFSVKAVTPKDSAWYVLTVSALDPDNYVIMRGEGRMVVADRSYVSSVISFSGGQPVPVEGALISLYSLEGGELYKWEASEYLQFNPIYTDMLGSFGFYVPNGKYVVKAEKENFYKYQSLPIEVKHNFIKHDIELIHIPGVNLWIYVLYAIVLISCYFLLRRIVLIIRDQRKHKEAYRRIGPYERN